MALSCERNRIVVSDVVQQYRFGDFDHEMLRFDVGFLEAVRDRLEKQWIENVGRR